MSLHKWRLLAQSFQQRKHVCTGCGTTRLVTNQSDAWPVTRYVSREGAVLMRAGECGEAVLELGSLTGLGQQKR